MTELDRVEVKIKIIEAHPKFAFIFFLELEQFFIRFTHFIPLF
jgi:hypothetical protein